MATGRMWPHIQGRQHKETVMTDSSANIDRFNALAAHLFSVLYDSFPKAVDIESALLAGGGERLGT